MKVYLAGPMRNYPRFNHDAFNAAEAALIRAGHEVWSPAAHDRLCGFDPDNPPPPGPEWDAFMHEAARWNIETLPHVHCICMLPGWERSEGASLELAVAQWLRLLVFSFDLNYSDCLGPLNEDAVKVAVSTPPSPVVKILRELEQLHVSKSADYGTGEDPMANLRASIAFGVDPWIGTIIRANDKMARLQAAASGSTLRNEGVEDSLLDLAGYAVLALALKREQDREDDK